MPGNPLDKYRDTRTPVATCIEGCGWVELQHSIFYPDDSGQSVPAANTPYQLHLPHGPIIYGMLDKNGFAQHEGIGRGTVRVVYEPNVDTEKQIILKQIKQAMDEFIAAERQESEEIKARMKGMSESDQKWEYANTVGRTTKDFVVGTVEFFGEMIWGAAKELHHLSQYLNPLAAPAAYERDAARFKQAHKELQALSDLDLGKYSVLMEDRETWQLFRQFANDYLDAQHSLEITEGGTEGVLAVILTIFTVGGGAAATASVGAAKIVKLGEKLADPINKLKVILERALAKKEVKGESHQLVESRSEIRHNNNHSKVMLLKMKQHKPSCFKPSDGLKKTFKDNPKKMEKEFYKQLKDQESGINKMSAGQYLQNRQKLNELTDKYGHEKARRILTGSGKAQEAAREELIDRIEKSVRASLKKQGVVGAEAKQIATEKAEAQLKQLAALHDPDLIAGGQDKISRVGNKNVNSSLGSQWSKESRVKEMDQAAKAAVKEHGPDVKMNVQLERCKN